MNDQKEIVRALDELAAEVWAGMKHHRLAVKYGTDNEVDRTVIRITEQIYGKIERAARRYRETL